MSAAGSWRDRIAVHPAADLFPMMDEAELRALGNDIRKNELKQPITVYAPHIRPDALQHGVKALKLAGDIRSKKDRGELELLDGRNRLAAMQLVGLRLDEVLKRAKIHWLDEGSPEEFVISANIHRRHLTPEQKRDLAAKLLKANPVRSDNATAKLAKVSDKTVTAVRREMEGRSEIPNVATRTDATGRRQPSRKGLSPRTNPSPLREAPAQARDKAIAGFSTVLHQQLAKTLDDLVRILGDQRSRVAEIPLQKRVVIARGYLHALGVSLDDLRPIDGGDEP